MNLVCIASFPTIGSGRDIRKQKGVCEDSSRLVREKTRARRLQIALLPPVPFSTWESEEFDERPHALFPTAGRKALGS
jgi:hypothetical protein